MKKLIVFAIAIFGFTAVSFGQPGNTATATVGASIITPITISATAMNFGTILAANTGTANVTIAPGGTTTYGTGLSYYSNTGAIATTPATFSVAGNFNNS